VKEEEEGGAESTYSANRSDLHRKGIMEVKYIALYIRRD